MSDLFIKDGKGRGNIAAVNNSQQLRTQSTVTTQEHEVSHEDGLAFVANTSDTANTLTSTATGGPVLYISNTHSTKNLVIEDIFMNSDTAGIVAVIKRNTTLGTIGNNNTHTPVNTNYSSAASAQAAIYNWDEVGDGMTGITAGTKMCVDILAVGKNRLNLNGVVVLGNANNIVIDVIGAGEVSVCARFYFSDKEVA